MGRGFEQRAFSPGTGSCAVFVGRKIMIVRIAAVVAILASFTVLGMPWGGSSTFRPTTASAAPAATSTNGLQFSTSVDSNARPENPRTEFGGGTDTVWVSFDFRGHDPGAEFSYLAR